MPEEAGSVFGTGARGTLRRPRLHLVEGFHRAQGWGEEGRAPELYRSRSRALYTWGRQCVTLGESMSPCRHLSTEPGPEGAHGDREVCYPHHCLTGRVTSLPKASLGLKPHSGNHVLWAELSPRPMYVPVIIPKNSGCGPIWK